MDDTHYSIVSVTKPAYPVYPELSSRAFYLHFILEMKKIFKKINQFVRFIINLLVRFILILLYFTLFFVLGILFRKFTDFLNTKKKTPAWLPHEAIKDAGEFLSRQ